MDRNAFAVQQDELRRLAAVRDTAWFYYGACMITVGRRVACINGDPEPRYIATEDATKQ